MNSSNGGIKTLLMSTALALVALTVGCEGGRDPILGGGGSASLAPTVTAVTPLNNATGVTITSPVINATFSEPMAAFSGGASFTVTRASGLQPTGTVAFNTANRIATYTPTNGPLASNTLYTATVTGAKSLATGLPLASPYIWRFTTGGVPDTIRPRVTSTIPVLGAAGVATNTAINAVFTEAMAPATISGTSFTVVNTTLGTPVSGNVTYVAASKTAVFAPAAALAANTLFTATLTTASTDLAGNQLAGNQAALPAASAFIWTFTTGAVPDSTPPTVILTSPVDLATGVALNGAVNATFSEDMDPLTISATTFTLQVSGPPLGANLLGLVAYDPLTRIATFTPSSNLVATTSYTATITIGAKDLAGNALVVPAVGGLPKPNPWTFTTGSAIVPPGVPLGSAATFGIMATSAITNTGAGTMINGDVSLDPGTSCGLLPVQVNGTIHKNDTVSAQARIDLLVAYNYVTNLPVGTTVTAGADLAAVYPMGVPPGTYTSGSTILVSTPLVLDAMGDVNATWYFQIGSSLTTSASVSLANGAQAKNVFWVPVQDATIGVGTIFYGTIVSGRDVTAQTGAVINGRILAGATTAGTIALDTNTVNVPAP